MGKRQRDCVDCGAPVGFLDRLHCCRCVRRMLEHAAKAPCPDCGKDRVLDPASGRCVLCSRRCSRCGGPIRYRGATVCRPCQRRAARDAAKELCPRCGKPGFLRERTGWCGSCSRPRPSKQPPRTCLECGQLRPHAGLGLCSPCWQRHPDRPFVRTDNLTTRLPQPPPWLQEFAAHLAAGFCASRASSLISALGRLLEDEHPNHPAALLDRARMPGRSMGSLARALEDFFTNHRLALPTDHAEQLAAGRRQRRVAEVPDPLRPGAAGFADSRLRARERARRAGTRPRSDHTIETALAIVRDLARFLIAERGKHQWALVDIGDIEAFLAGMPKSRKRRLTVLRQFFRFARAQRLVLVDPTKGLYAKESNNFRGRTLTLDQQRTLFRRWTTDADVHPHEALVGMLALLHGASSQEARLLRIGDVDRQAQALRMGTRPHPVPLDPASWAVLQRCLAHRDEQRTDNPHVIVTKGTKAGRGPSSTAYLSHVLDGCGFSPRVVRSTRLVDLVNTMDPKLVAAAFGMDPQAPLIYLADHVDAGRLPERPTPTPREQS